MIPSGYFCASRFSGWFPIWEKQSQFFAPESDATFPPAIMMSEKLNSRLVGPFEEEQTGTDTMGMCPIMRMRAESEVDGEFVECQIHLCRRWTFLCGVQVGVGVFQHTNDDD